MMIMKASEESFWQTEWRLQKRELEIFNPFGEMLTTKFPSLYDNMSVNIKASSCSLAVFYRVWVSNCVMSHDYISELEMLFFVAEGSAAPLTRPDLPNHAYTYAICQCRSVWLLLTAFFNMCSYASSSTCNYSKWKRQRPVVKEQQPLCQVKHIPAYSKETAGC